MWYKVLVDISLNKIIPLLDLCAVHMCTGIAGTSPNKYLEPVLGDIIHIGIVDVLKCRIVTLEASINNRFSLSLT